jgi:hypothetical protein
MQLKEEKQLRAKITQILSLGNVCTASDNKNTKILSWIQMNFYPNPDGPAPNQVRVQCFFLQCLNLFSRRRFRLLVKNTAVSYPPFEIYVWLK